MRRIEYRARHGGGQDTRTRRPPWRRQTPASLAADSIDDVGYEVGYEEPTFFRRLFRRSTGLTPAAYRRKYAAITTGVPAG